MTTNYLNNIVYHRKGTSIIIPETEANKTDPNLVPITVENAIKLGYMQAPSDSDRSIESRLAEENQRLKDQIEKLQAGTIPVEKEVNIAPVVKAPVVDEKVEDDNPDTTQAKLDELLK